MAGAGVRAEPMARARLHFGGTVRRARPRFLEAAPDSAFRAFLTLKPRDMSVFACLCAPSKILSYVPFMYEVLGNGSQKITTFAYDLYNVP